MWYLPCWYWLDPDVRDEWDEIQDDGEDDEAYCEEGNIALLALGVHNDKGEMAYVDPMEYDH